MLCADLLCVLQVYECHLALISLWFVFTEVPINYRVGSVSFCALCGFVCRCRSRYGAEESWPLRAQQRWNPRGQLMAPLGIARLSVLSPPCVRQQLGHCSGHDLGE